MKKSTLQGAGMLTACVLAALCGNWLAERGQSGASSGATAGQNSAESSTGAATKSRGAAMDGARVSNSKAGTRTPEELKVQAKDLLAAYQVSPNPRSDWELHDRTRDILSKLSPEELRQMAEGLIPLEENEAERQSKNFRALPDALGALMQDILIEWGRQDPEGALSSRTTLGAMGKDEVFQQWAGQDREAAETWLLSGGPEHFKGAVGYLRSQYLGNLAVTDFDAALGFWQKADRGLRVAALNQWGEVLAGDSEKTAKLLRTIQASSDPAQAMDCYKPLLSGLAMSSPEKAAELAESLQLPEEQQAELTNAWIGGWAQNSPAEALSYWAEAGEEKVPAAVRSALSTWSIHSPKEMETWLGKLPDGASKEGLKVAVVPTLVKFEHFDQAIKVATSIRDQDQRLQQLRLLGRSLEEMEPGSMEKLAESLPEADRAKFRQ